MAEKKTRRQAFCPRFVLRTQVALVRNIRGVAFPGRLSERQAAEIGDRLAQRLMGLRPFVDETKSEMFPPSRLEALFGLSAEGERGAGYHVLRLNEPRGEMPDIWCEVMSVNHLVFSMMVVGQVAEEQLAAFQAEVDSLAEPLDYVWHEQLGYLTAQLPLVGSGFRIRSWVHVPALSHFDCLAALSHAAEAFGVLADLDRPVSPPGDVVILFNRSSLDGGAQTLRARVVEFVEVVKRREMEMRKRLLCDEPFLLMDVLQRAGSVLRAALLIGEDEARDLLSDVVLGVSLGVVRIGRAANLSLLNTWYDCCSSAVLLNLPLSKEAPELPLSVREHPSWNVDAVRAQWLRQYSSLTISSWLLRRV